MHPFRSLLALGAIAVILLPAGSGEAVSLASHRAGYRLALDTARPNPDVESAAGAMLYEVVDRCEGWTVEQRFTLQVVSRSGQAYEMASDYVTWEEKDGTRFRFRLRQATDGAVVQTLIGEARIDPATGAAEARYTAPDQQTIALPRGTMFPMQHTLRLLEAAERGARVFPAPIFDGTEEDGARDTNTVIFARLAPDASHPQPALRPLPSFRVRIAFFDPQGTGQPEYEIGIRYFANGVADDLRMDFGEFAVRGELVEYEELAGGCN
ncbi:MAG: cell envelope integrity EipB family protein [Elioraea sp.]|nr:cell envelope integrity EipB family protein [Elioraea sp.]MDW8443498.1 cell envelope integrity EipB family protein [Acetobacteraceae bacterium]